MNDSNILKNMKRAIGKSRGDNHHNNMGSTPKADNIEIGVDIK
jgi:hypothetical protein